MKGRLPEQTRATLTIPFARDEAGFVEDHELLWGRKVFVTADGRAVLPETVESAEVTADEVRLRLRPGAAFNVTRRRPASS